MKHITFLLTALIVLTLVSCQRDNDDPAIPPEERAAKMLIQYKYYNNGTLDQEFYFQHYMDSAANIRYKTYDTVNYAGFRYLYDANDRLIKVVWDFTFYDPTEKDSVVITRPSVNTVVFKPSFEGPSGGELTYTAVTTDIGGGRKRINVETTGDISAGYFIDDLYLSADGKLDSSVQKFYTSGGLNTSTQVRKVTYNASGNAASIVDVDYAANIYVHTRTITRDNNDNTAIEALVKNSWGSDLEWLAYTLDGFGLVDPREIIGDNTIPDIFMVKGGSLLTYSTNSKVYNKSTGALIEDQGSVLTESLPVYYPDSKLKSIQEKYDGEVRKTMDLKYYN